MDLRSDLLVRPATEEDLPGLADLFWAARAAAAPWMPPSVHGFDEVRAHYLDLPQHGREAWLAEDGRGTVGFVTLKDDWLEDLYVRPDAQRDGVGATLLDLVKAVRPAGFALWVFESNGPARAFYARHGLVEREHTDGSDNDERAPDLRMSWSGGARRFVRRAFSSPD
ncbi:GNAT family N-acetyltransferase [Nocardioides sambongensis]|uniref:GNAT family N-acetyltransferase n=1 Tax=Nocardioides sambongensis TaxID=2589074 RepID=UPI001126BC9E|nr:GNAT family N-acetyltransferase [Nocardioides sambongensis]